MKPWRKTMWCIPPKQDGQFVARMEQVLEVYRRPYDPSRPVVCLDEQPFQLVSESRRSIPMGKGQPERIDHEYTREGDVYRSDRAEIMAQVRAAQAERASYQLELARKKDRASRSKPITAEEARQVLADLGSLLQDGATGLLGSEGVYKAANAFKRLVGGEVEVLVEVRPGRKRAVVRGRFTPRLLATLVEVGGLSHVQQTLPTPVEVWLRRPPRLDTMAAEVRRLYEEEGLGFRTIAKKLGIGCGYIYKCYLRYYELQGLPVPPRRPPGRHPGSQQ